MMTGFLAVQGIEVHAETQQMTGDVESTVESVELGDEITEEGDRTDTGESAESEEPLPEGKPEEELPVNEEAQQPEEKTDPSENEDEEEERLLPPTVIPDPEKEPAEKWEEETPEESDEDETESEVQESEGSSGEEPDSEDSETMESEPESPAPIEQEPEEPEFEEPKTENPEAEETKEESTKQEELKPGESKSEEPGSEEKKPEKEKLEEPKPEEPGSEEQKPEKQKPEELKPKEQPPAEPEPDESKTESSLPVAEPEEVTKSPDDTPLQTEESSPPSAETPSESAEEEPAQIPPQIIADFIFSQMVNEEFETPQPLTIYPADTSAEVDAGYTPEILLEGAADTAEILSCMVNGSEADYEWKENKICLKAESLSEGYNRITVKVRGADGVVRTMKPWEVNVKPKSSTLVSSRTVGRKSTRSSFWQSLRRFWNLIRAIAEIQNQTTRYLRAICRK